METIILIVAIVLIAFSLLSLSAAALQKVPFRQDHGHLR